MSKNFLLFSSLFFIIIIAVLHITAGYFFLYWVFPWFDILVHFLGGFWVAITFVWLYFFSEFSSGANLNSKNVLKISILAFLVIALSWEIFEVFLRENITQPNYVFDTILDIVVGFLGSLFAYLYIKYFYKLKSQDEQV